MKTLLTVHEIDDDISSLQNLIRLAGHAGAHLHVVVLGVVRVVPMTAAPGVPDYYFSEANQEMIAAGKARIKEIEKLIAQENISASVTLECRDPALVEQTIRRHAMFCDAAVFPQLSVPGSDLKSRAMNGALLNAVSPVLVLDPELTQLPDVNIIQFAWSGEIPAAKAVHQSLPWISGKAKAHVVVVDPDEYVMGPNPGDDVAAYLTRQGLEVSVDRLPGGRREVSEILLEHATDINADLMVMGAYGKSRLTQWLLGGTTQSMLESAKIPLLLSN